MEKFNRTYEHLSPNLEPIWCAKVNLVLAIGCRAIPGSNEDQICGLFENALGYLSAIILGCSNIQKVQTLTLMVKPSPLTAPFKALLNVDLPINSTFS